MSFDRRPCIAELALSALLLLSPAPAPAQSHDHGTQGADVRLYDDLGTHHRPITTRASEAQAYFDQGLRLEYAFNHPEAIRSYEAALQRDPECAMCYWGIALASGPNINAAMAEESGRRAYRASREALKRVGGVTPVERALIEALAERYSADDAVDRSELDRAWERSMAGVASRFGNDADVLTLHAASRMVLTPWNYWEGDYADRRPRPGTEETMRALERALSVDADNPGACHYYIHLVEAALPHKAVACADRLAALMPGAGHIVHMPGHIYIRVGRYADAVEANVHAAHADESMIMDIGTPSLYAGTYYPHNYHFMAFAATMAGMGERALEAARIVSPKVPHEVALEVYWIQNAVVMPHLTLVNFGRWDEVIAEPMPSASLGQATLLATYARGVAFAALGREDDAALALASVRAATGPDASEDPIGHIAALALEGEIALRGGDATTAVRAFEAAALLEDGLLYEEPPLWYYPIRHSLGVAYLEAGRPADAERAYRQDLDRFPDNGWSLYGLAKALDAQGQGAEAEAVRDRFRAAWAHADVRLKASRY